ncbi:MULTISPECIES: hypothetical protein [Enterobacterales]|uniref:hypothetical protein n=1 Tax=Enterobacterales TaxID=91347 RepID=UPI002ED981FF
MKKVLVFFNAEPLVVVSVNPDETSISREYPNGETASLKIMSASFASLTGDHHVVHVATDRELAAEEILKAAEKYL